MVCKISIVISLIIFLSSDSYGAVPGRDVKSPPSSSSILNDIMTEVKTNNSEICPTPKEILKSDYVKKCDKLTFPSATTHLTPTNHDTFLCLALYDRAFHICYRGSLGLKIPALQNTTAFDELIADEIINHKTSSLKVCESFEYTPPALFNKTKSFVDELSEALKFPDKCIHICWNKELKKINPLCLVINIIDDEIQKEVPKKDAAAGGVKEKGEKKNETTLKAELKNENTEAQHNTKVITEVASKIVIPPLNPQANVKSPSADNLEQSAVKSTDNHQTPVKTSPQIDIAHKDVGLKKVVEQNKSKIGTEQAQTIVQNEKYNSPTQGQSPPVSDHEVKKVDIPKEDSIGPKDENSPSQLIPPAKDVVEKEMEKSTVSENTGNGDGDMQLENYGSNEGGMAGAIMDDDVDGETMSSPKQLETPEEKNQESFEQTDHIPKFSRITPDDDSHFFGYFTIFGLFGIGLFAAYHHKHKIFAMLLEGRRSRGGRGRRRPSTANYRKLDCTLEEAVTSQCSSNVTHVIY